MTSMTGFAFHLPSCATPRSCICLQAHPGCRRAGREPRGLADQAAGQPRPAGGHGRLARAVAGPPPAAAGPRRYSGVRRQSRGDGAGRLGLSGRRDGPDGGEFQRRRRRHQSAGQNGGRQPARYRACARRADRRFHPGAGHGRGGVPGRGRERCRRGCARCGPGLPGRDGHRQYHRGIRHRGGPVRGRRRPLGRPRHRRGSCRSRPQAGRHRCRARPPRRRARRPADDRGGVWAAASLAAADPGGDAGAARSGAAFRC